MNERKPIVPPEDSLGDRTVVMATTATTGNEGHGTCPFELGEVIGSGGMGSVHFAKQDELFRQVAVKVLHDPENSNHQRAFAAELLATAHLEHPAVVPVHRGGPGFMAQRRISGATLQQHLAERSDPSDDLERMIEALIRIA
ncbi:MAG: protein kinase, partial [Planctomycetota bacterium]